MLNVAVPADHVIVSNAAFSDVSAVMVLLLYVCALKLTRVWTLDVIGVPSDKISGLASVTSVIVPDVVFVPPVDKITPLLRTLNSTGGTTDTLTFATSKGVNAMIFVLCGRVYNYNR